MTDYIALDIIRDLTRARVTRFSLSSFFGRDGLLLVTAFGVTACGGGGGSGGGGRSFPVEVIGVEPPTYRGASHDENVIFGDNADIASPTDLAVQPAGFYLYGDNRANEIEGSAAVDTIAGGAGNDEVDAGAGDDRIWGEGGNDRLYGDGGNDRIWGGDGADTIRGGAGNDYLWGGGGADSLDGGAGNDIILLIGSDGATRGGTSNSGYTSVVSGGINFGERFGIDSSHVNTDSVYRTIVGDDVDGGEGADRLVVFGKADLTGRTGVGASVDNIETIIISGEVTIDEFDLLNGGRFSDVEFVGELDARLDIRDENGDGVINLGTSVFSGNLDVRAVDTAGTEIAADYVFSDDTLFSLVSNDRAAVRFITFGADSAQASLTLQELSSSYAAFAVELESTSLTGSDMWDLATSGNAMHDATSNRVWISPETIDLLRGGYDAATRKFTIVQANDNLELRFGNGTMTLQGDFADADDNDDSVVDFNEFLGAIATANAGYSADYSRLLALELVIAANEVSHVKEENILLDSADYPPIDFDPDITSITQRIYQADSYGEDRVGTRHDDRLFGYLGSNMLDGLAGNDEIIGGHGNDLIDGGVGEDTAIYFTDIEISGSTVTSATEGTDSLTSIELIRLQGVHTVDVEGDIDAILDFSHDSAQVLDFDDKDRGTFTIRGIDAEDKIDLRDAGFTREQIVFDVMTPDSLTIVGTDSGTGATLTINGVMEENILRPGDIYGDYRIDFTTSGNNPWNLVNDMGMVLANGDEDYDLSPRYDIIFVDTSSENDRGTINTLQALRAGFDANKLANPAQLADPAQQPNNPFIIAQMDDNLELRFGNGTITLQGDFAGADSNMDNSISFDEFLSAIGANNIEFG